VLRKEVYATQGWETHAGQHGGSAEVQQLSGSTCSSATDGNDSSFQTSSTGVSVQFPVEFTVGGNGIQYSKC
jgi:hypothetical protein